MTSDWVDRASQLLQSRRIAGSVVLGVCLAGAIALFASETVSSLTRLNATVQLLVLGVLLIACYALGVLIIGVAIDAFQGARARRRETREAAARRVATESARLEGERKLRAVLPELTTDHYEFLSRFEARNPGDRPSATLGPRAENAIEPDLTRLGIIAEIGKIERNRTLFELTPAAAEIVPAFVSEWRRKMITASLRRAGEPEKTLLHLFGIPGPQTPGEPLHSFITRDVYSTIYPFQNSLVLERSHATQPGPTETISLTRDAIPLVEEMIIGEKVVRTSVVLDLDNVQGTGASGSGARGSSRPYPLR
jgi:hypothetical protein